MADETGAAPIIPAVERSPIVHLTCPVCHSPKAMVVASRYGEQMCFCPACEHAWDCAEAPPGPTPA